MTVLNGSYWRWVEFWRGFYGFREWNSVLMTSLTLVLNRPKRFWFWKIQKYVTVVFILGITGYLLRWIHVFNWIALWGCLTCNYCLQSVSSKIRSSFKYSFIHQQKLNNVTGFRSQTRVVIHWKNRQFGKYDSSFYWSKIFTRHEILLSTKIHTYQDIPYSEIQKPFECHCR